VVLTPENNFSVIGHNKAPKEVVVEPLLPNAGRLNPRIIKKNPFIW